MAEVRVIAELTAKDSEAAANFVQRVSTFVETNLPDTLAWESFTDEATGRWIWYEVFKDEQALAAYERVVNQEGMREDAGKIFEFDRVTLLTPLADPRLKELFEQIGAVEMRGVAGFTR